MPDFDEYALSKLAREMAMNIRNHKAIFADYNIDEAEFYEVSKIPFFQRCVEQYTLEWNATTSTAERVKVMSAAATEQILPYVSARATRPEEPLAAAAKILELTSRMAGIGEGKRDGSNPDAKFSIVINLGSDVNGKPIIEKFDEAITINASTDVVMATSSTAPLTPEEIGLLSLMRHED